MTRAHADALEAVAADAEDLAWHLEEYPELTDDPTLAAMLRGLAIHHRAAADSAARMEDHTTGAILLDAELKQERRALANLHAQLERTAEDAVHAERRWHRQLVLAIIAGAILVVAIGAIGWFWATRI